MSSLCLFPDRVEITPVSEDSVTGAKTRGTTYTAEAYWKESSTVRYGSDGEPLAPDVKVNLPAGTPISFGDEVTLVNKSGVVYTGTLFAVTRKAKRVYPVGDYEPSHVEVAL